MFSPTFTNNVTQLSKYSLCRFYLWKKIQNHKQTGHHRFLTDRMDN